MSNSLPRHHSDRGFDSIKTSSGEESDKSEGDDDALAVASCPRTNHNSELRTPESRSQRKYAENGKHRRGDATGAKLELQDAKQFADLVELEEAGSGDGDPHYQVVKKSIYKPARKGFLHRLASATVASPPKHSSYVLSDITDILTEDGETTAEPVSVNASMQELDVESLEEEEGIQLAIDRPPELPAASREAHEHCRRLNAEDAAMGGPSEVVIHSGEGDSGFATLNPVISGNLQRTSSGGANYLTSYCTTAAPGTTASTAVAVGKDKPLLVEIPATEDAKDSGVRVLLVVNALGASGLHKAEKFGTQSCFLEMRLSDRPVTVGSSTENSRYSSSVMRTGLHKKGGSEAQWNQQFTTTLRCKNTQFLHAVVKTSSKILVGEASIPLDKVENLFYDQHYLLYRLEDSSESATSVLSDDAALVCSGQLHLQLKIVEATAVSTPSTLVPALRLPFSSTGSSSELGRKSSLCDKRIPLALQNGGLFFKIPYHSHNLVGYTAGPKREWVAVTKASDPPRVLITWGDPTVSVLDEKNHLRSLDLDLVTGIREGHGTKAFAAQTDSNVVKEKEKCFSLVTETRTLDLVAASKEAAQIWVSGLRELIFSPEEGDETSLLSARTINDYKQSALSSRGTVGSSSEKPPVVAPTKRMLAGWRNRIFNLARSDRLDDIAECLKDGCPIDLLETGTGDTLLMLACRQGSVQLVELCLSRRAKNDPHPEFGETALQVAVGASNPQCLELLLSTAAKSDMDSEIVNHIDPNNDAPLHVAARHGDLACLQLLLHHGADICVVEEFGRTPLHCAVANGNLDCVAYLLDVGGDLVLNSGDHDGDTALHYAALSGNEATVKLLLESAADVFSTNTHRETPYDIAVREQQQKCAELIARYFLTNEKETPSVPAPVTWNEPASVLLGRPKRVESPLAYRDADGFEDDFEDRRSSISSSISSGRPEVWEVPRPASTTAYGDEYGSYQPFEKRPVNPVDLGIATSRVTLSPSEQVREALTRNHRSNSFSRGDFRPPRGENRYYSAREASGFLPPSSYNERAIATERCDRGYDRHTQRFSMFQLDTRYPQAQQWEYRSHHDQQSLYGGRNRSQTAPDYPQGYYSYWSADVSRNDVRRPSRTNTPTPRFQDEVPTAVAWSQYSHPTSNRYEQQTPNQQVDPSKWDTLYNDDGYPYYVNRVTGVSQWEKPPAENYGRDIHVTPQPQVETRSNSLTPDALFRQRLAEARKQRSRTVSAPTAKTSPPQSSIPDAACQRQLALDTEKAPQPTTSLPVNVATTIEAAQVGDPLSLVQTRAAIDPVEDLQSRCEAPELSKYEVRTGFKLSVNVSAPPALDDSHPVMIPSPRSKSPTRKSDQHDSVQEPNTAGSFQKSRASSPRGRSKSIQIIELKRANNLALALASFKINDHYEKIVNDIVTMDDSVVNAALLGCLQRFFPTEKEKQAIQSFNGSISSLGKAERFFCLLFQVPGMQERIDMFLYKMEFTRTHANLLSKVLVVKRACRDLVENFSFVQALERFFKKQQAKSFGVFENEKKAFIAEYLADADEKLKSFRVDLQKAERVELMDLQLQLNRFVSGTRPIRAFVDRSPSSSTKRPEDRDGKARDILQRFLLESRGPLDEIESEYEAMELWSDKLLAVFGESKASCHVSAVLQGVVQLLH